MPAPHIYASLSDTQIAPVFKVLLGLSPREVDIQVLRLMGATPHNVAEYIWDHWLGEPNEPTVESIEQEIERILASLHTLQRWNACLHTSPLRSPRNR